VDSAFVDVTSANSYPAGGKFRVLGITGTQRHAALPAVPTFAEAGLSGFEPNGWFLCPAGTPRLVLTGWPPRSGAS
jgi:tripartite-type tricarboxylate transporter receptor subunit TctC